MSDSEEYGGAVDRYEKGDDIQLDLDATVLEVYQDDSILVDADGKQLLVYEGEYK